MPDAREVYLVLDDVCRHLDEDASLDRLAHRSGWSACHLQRAVKRVAGETPKQFVLRVRLERAAAALLATDDQIIAIALDSGFASHEVFSRAFRRRFDCSPRDYRARHRDMPEADRHREVVAAAGPCLRLHHQPLHPHRGLAMSQPEITTRELTEQPIVYIERKAAMNELPQVFAEVLPKVFAHCQQRGLAMVGPPLVRYGAMTPGHITIQGAMPVAQPAEPEGEVQAGTLPGGQAAVALHVGAYEGLPGSHAALEKWLDAEGHQPRGSRWEVYLTDPATTPDPADWRTEIVAPLA